MATAAPRACPVFAERFRFIRPTLPPLERVLEYYRSVYADGQITNSDLVLRFERAAAERLNVRECVAVSSCTAGLALVICSLGLTGEVILPSFTFFATGHAILWNGLRPVFADCDPETWTLDPADVERRITERTSAIIGVHLYGNPCRIDELADISRRHGLKLIFDAAHAFGSEYKGGPVGQFGDAEVFSFSPTKLLVAGEGGLVGTNDAVLARRLRAARNYGDLGAYNPEVLGLNARMSEFNAALALAGLELMEPKLKRHNAIAAAYTTALSRVPGLSFQKVETDDVHTYKDYSIHVDEERFGMSRDELVAALLAENIETKKYFFPPMHRQDLYVKFYDGSHQPLLHSDRVSEGILSLPIYGSLPDETVEKVAASIESMAEVRGTVTGSAA